MLKEREEWNTKTKIWNVQSVEAEYKLNERTIQKKLYLGLKLKGKGRLCCLYFKKIVVCNNYLLADNETKRLKKHHQRWLYWEGKFLKLLKIDFIKMGFLTNEWINGLGLFSRLTYWQHCYRREHYWRSFWRSSSLDLVALQGPSYDPSVLLDHFRGLLATLP